MDMKRQANNARRDGQRNGRNGKRRGKGAKRSGKTRPAESNRREKTEQRNRVVRQGVAWRTSHDANGMRTERDAGHD